jgi:hypothetical protein
MYLPEFNYRPVAPRASTQLLSYAALTVQALFHIPQLREALMHLLPPDDALNSAEGKGSKSLMVASTHRQALGKATWALLRTFALLDLSVIHGLELDTWLEPMGARPATGPNDSISELTHGSRPP